jgi:hypothetical protein
MLPALAVQTPRASADRSARSRAFEAPRSLKEPMGWSVSSLSQISAAGEPASRRTSGVRVTYGAIRSRAARISPTGTGSTGFSGASGCGEVRALV